MSTIEQVAESNRIEGILRPPTKAELAEHERFVGLVHPTIDDLIQFVSVYQPGAKLRDKPGLDVRVGNHVPPSGGPGIRTLLIDHLDNQLWMSAWKAHVDYETLHPFTDGNGRSGRALWYWRMKKTRLVELGFLHGFYYQTLAEDRRV